MSGSGSGGWDPTGVGEDFRDGVLFREARSLSNGGTVSTAFPPISTTHPHRAPVFAIIWKPK